MLAFQVLFVPAGLLGDELMVAGGEGAVDVEPCTDTYLLDEDAVGNL